MGFKRSWVQIPPARDGFEFPQMNTGSCSRLILLAVLMAFSGNARAAKGGSARLNDKAFDFAVRLISQRRFIADKKGAWMSHHSTRSQENAFIQANGFTAYANWFLAIDDRHPTDSKARYKFPLGDFERVHRCGLLAIKSRAHQYGYQEIEAAAIRLLKMIESARPSRQKRVD